MRNKITGLSKRELERQANSIMRRIASDQSELAKHTIETVIELIVKNNEAITVSLNDLLPDENF